MIKSVHVAFPLVLAAFLALFLCQAMAQAEVINGGLANVSSAVPEDGRAIPCNDLNSLDMTSNRVGTQPVTVANAEQRKGCMRCWNECVIYEGERCVKWVRTCQWNFDC